MNQLVLPHQVDHLFLLMGGNALPNYVAALTLLKPNGKAYLIHTSFSELQAKRIAELLRDRSDLQPAMLIDLKDGQAEAAVIRQSIQGVAQHLRGRVGLNYTGGTKVMSVYAHRAISELYSEAVFSYLDSNTLEMMIDDETAASLRFKVPLKLSFEQLFRLHGLQWRNNCPPLDRATHPVAALQFAKLYQSPALSRAWRNWCEQTLKRTCQTSYGRWDKEWQLTQTPPLSLQGLPAHWQTLLEQQMGAVAQKLLLQTARKQGFQTTTQLCEWLDGIWLEDYVLQQIQQIPASYEIHENQMSFRMQDPADQNADWDKFEFDVAFMRHYQMFALSCTTSENRKLCKQKLIEANTRAQQLGGIEARVALVCASSDPDSLRKELEVATRNRKIAVFGRQDWQSLSGKIMKWVEQNG